jgi:hypothetical protein
MKKFLLTFILGFTSCGALADWTYISHSEDQRYYISPSSVRDTVQGVKQAWTMSENKNNAMKMATFDQFDCVNGTSKMSHIVLYDIQDKPIGEPLHYPNEPHKILVPGTIGYSKLQSVCNVSQVYAYNSGQGYNNNSGVQGRGGCAENGSCYGDISRFNGQPKTNYVNGYYRSNGTYVRGHYRSR